MYVVETSFDKILSDLNVITSLTEGMTLSSSSMTVIPHKSWSTSIWRLYSGENRKETIKTIKDIFARALICYTMNPSEKMENALREALQGLETLRDTYKGDYYSCVDITNFITETKVALDVTLKEISFDEQKENTASTSPFSSATCESPSHVSGDNSCTKSDEERTETSEQPQTFACKNIHTEVSTSDQESTEQDQTPTLSVEPTEQELTPKVETAESQKSPIKNLARRFRKWIDSIEEEQEDEIRPIKKRTVRMETITSGSTKKRNSKEGTPTYVKHHSYFTVQSCSE
jgi:hypothetical protein